MTDKELIEAQETDIRNLLNTIRIKDNQIEALTSCVHSLGTEFKFDTPYYRLETNYITCYRLVNIVWHKWYKSQAEPELDLRFSQLFMISLKDLKVYRGGGGNRVLKTCISYEDLYKKLDRRKTIASNKNDINLSNKWDKTIQLIKDETNKCTAFFEEEV